MGTLAGRIGELAGMPLDPFQQHIFDVALELDPDTGRFVYRVVVVVIARQNGKTVVLKVRILTGLFGETAGPTILHTAQDRALPRETFIELADMAVDTPFFAERLEHEPRTANGQEHMTAVTLGGDRVRYSVRAPRQGSVRGPTSGLVVIDEIREHRDSEVWSAALYTMRTHPNPQIWVASNAGDIDSTVLNGLRDRGRAAAEDPGSDPTIAYFEWSADPIYAVDDRQGWVQANPALGIRITEDTLADELATELAAADGDGERRFRTEALCQWIDEAADPAIDLDAWLACTVEPPPPITAGDRVAAAFDQDPDTGEAALALAAELDDGRIYAAVVAQWPDIADQSEVAAEIDTWCQQWAPTALGYNPYTAGAVIDRLGPHIIRHKLSGAAFIVACSQFVDAIDTGRLVHSNQPILRAQIPKARKKVAADGAWRLVRGSTQEPIHAVLATARAVALTIDPTYVSPSDERVIH